MRRPRGSFAALALAYALVAATALADPLAPSSAADAGTQARRIVELIVIGGGRDGQRLLDTVTLLLEREGLGVEAHAVASAEDVSSLTRGSAAARVQVDLRESDEATIVSEGHGPNAVRRVVRRDPGSTVALEEVALAIESAVESRLLADAELEPPAAPPASVSQPAPLPESGPAVDAASPSRAEADAPDDPGWASDDIPPPDEPSPGRSSGLGLDLSTLGGAGGVASHTNVVAALGGEVGLASRRGWRPSISVLADAILPFDATGDSVDSHTSVLDTRVLGGFAPVSRPWLLIETGAGCGAEVVWSAPQSTVLASSVLGSPSTRVGALVSAFAAAHVSPTPTVAITVMVLGDLAIAPGRYVVVEGSRTDVVFAPWNLRPTVLAGFTFTAFGPAAFARRRP